MFFKSYELKDCSVKLVVYDRTTDEVILPAMYLKVFFSRFLSIRMFNKRYVSSRFKLLTVLGSLSNYKYKYGYSFSHSLNNTALVATSKPMQVSVDIEPKNRQFHSALECRLRSIFPSVNISVLKIISILECLVKLSVIDRLTKEEGGISDFDRLSIRYYNEDTVISSTLNGVTMYSKFFGVKNLNLCVTTNNIKLLS